MAKHGCYDGCASGLRKFCDEYDGKPCKNMVRIASGLYEQGYRKIPEDSVVLSKEEYEKLKIELAIAKKRADESYTQKEVEEIIASKERIKSKETAKEILQTIMDIIKKSDCFLSQEVVRIMAKQFGVEVKE